MVSPETLKITFQVLLALFLGTTAFLMLATLINRLRIRRILFTWCAGRLRGLPVMPTFFLGVISPLFIYSLFETPTSPYLHPLLLIGYLGGGFFWYVASLISQSIIVTDYCIIQNVNRIGKAISWGQIVDYFYTTHKHRHHYVFFYMNKRGKKQRIEIMVPPAYQERFHQVVESKVDARFTFSMEQTYGKTASNLWSDGA